MKSQVREYDQARAYRCGDCFTLGGRLVVYFDKEPYPVKADPEAWRAEYAARQEAGVKFEAKSTRGNWHKKWCAFDGNKEDYREVEHQSGHFPPIKGIRDEVEALKPTTPHLAERALYWSQRAAGTNEVWQEVYSCGTPCDIPVDKEPAWYTAMGYRVKPKTVTYLLALCRSANGSIDSMCTSNGSEADFCSAMAYDGRTIIGNIETREAEVSNG